MKMNKIWMVACMAATLIGGVYGCDDDKDFSYEGQLDLNLLNLTQAREVWDGAECNVTTDLRQSEDETPVKNFTYKLSLSLYQGRTAGQEAKVSLVAVSYTHLYPKPTKFTHEAFPLVNPSRAWWSNFSPKWYLSAFPPSEVNKKYGLTQNPGWN